MMESLSPWKKTLLLCIALVLLGLLQTPLFINLQLLMKKAVLFPKPVEPTAVDAVLIVVASIFLIIRGKDFGKREWWIGFAAMALPYAALKWLGIYYDHTNYIIAQYEGRHIGGGAAMAHVPLFFYLMGPAQALSALGFYVTRRFAKKS